MRRHSKQLTSKLTRRRPMTDKLAKEAKANYLPLKKASP
jgi:hypothetical protein